MPTTRVSGNASRWLMNLATCILDMGPGMTSRAAEKAMDQFAGAFLVPSEELERLAGAHRSELSLGELLELKAHFRVSLAVSGRASGPSWDPFGSGGTPALADAEGSRLSRSPLSGAGPSEG